MDSSKQATPDLSLLNRRDSIRAVRKHFHPQLDMMRSMVNYGTSLIPAALKASERDLGDIVIISVLLKHLVSMFDSFEVLLSNCCAETSYLQSRSIFETSIYIDFMLAGESERKAQFYYVSNIRKEITWAKRAKHGTTEREQFIQDQGDFLKDLEDELSGLNDDAEQELQKMEAFLEEEPWKSVNEAINRQRGKAKFDRPWYAGFGVRSLRQMSERVGRLGEYEILYSEGSEVLHASNYRRHIRMGQKHIALEPIRHSAEMDKLIRTTASIVLFTYSKIMQDYCQDRVAEFHQVYLDLWRMPFINIPKVNYKFTQCDF